MYSAYDDAAVSALAPLNPPPAGAPPPLSGAASDDNGARGDARSGASASASAAAAASHGVAIHLLDAAALTRLRADTHVGTKDCLHHARPGVLDAWTTLLFGVLEAALALAGGGVAGLGGLGLGLGGGARGGQGRRHGRRAKVH